MFHFLKYLILTAFVFALLNLLRSNMALNVSLTFEVPYLHTWETLPLPLNYLLLIAFCVGILFAGFLGALKAGSIKARNREIKELKKTLEIANRQSIYSSSPKESLPPLAE